MPQHLNTTSQSWGIATDRFWTRGRSTDLQAIDTALRNYETLKATNVWNSPAMDQSLQALKAAVITWKTNKGVKTNGNIDSKRDSKGEVSAFLREIDGVLQTIAQHRPANPQAPALPPPPVARPVVAARGLPPPPPPPRTPTPQERAAASQKAFDAANTERSGGMVYVKDDRGHFIPKGFSQEQHNSCTCACACTYASRLTGVALKEDVFRKEVDRVEGAHHDFNRAGSYFPPIAQALVNLRVDAKHTVTTSFPQLAIGLKRATRDQPVMFGVRWLNGNDGHAVLCIGPGKVYDTYGTAYDGYLIDDPWPEHDQAMMYEDGSFWVLHKPSRQWIGATAAVDAGYISGKRGRI